MASKMLWWILVLILQMNIAEGASGNAFCKPEPLIGTGDFIMEFELDTEGDNVAGISFYNASEDPDFTTKFETSPCLDTTATSGTIYNIQLSVDTNSLPCGAQYLGGNEYKFAAVADGINKVFIFSCDTDDLVLPSSVNQTIFSTPVLKDTLHIRNNPRGVKFQVVDANSRLPTDLVALGQEIELWLIYDKQYTDNGPDNMGYIFHTAFMLQVGTTLTLNIITLSLGTRVHVTGALPGSPVDTWVYVKVGSPATVSIPNIYAASSASTTTANIDLKGLKIESLDARIGVTVYGVSDSGDLAFVVLPDRILDTNYRLASLDNWQVRIVGTVDSTTLTLSYNSYPIAGFSILGVDDSPLGSISSVIINEGETLTILCVTTCSEIFVSASSKIAVLCGGDNIDIVLTSGAATAVGDFATQIPGLSSYSTKFAFHDASGTSGTHRYIVITDSIAASSYDISFGTGGSLTGIPSNNIISLNGGNFDIETSENIIVIQYLADDDSSAPAINLLPSIQQWGVYQAFYAQSGLQYKIVIFTTAGNAQSIVVKTFGVSVIFTSSDGTLGGSTSSAFTVIPVAGITINKEVYSNLNDFLVIDTNKKEQGIISFHAGASNAPFLLSVTVFNPMTGDTSSLTASGTRFPPVNPCIPTTGFDFDPDFATSIYTGPGDLLDNDCDGLVDEEQEDGLADPLPYDNDNDEDEDLALKVEKDVGIFVTKLLISNTADFTGIYTDTVHNDGCNTNLVGSAIGSIKEFKHNSNLNPIFDQFYVIDTGRFKAYGWINDGINPYNPVYFRVFYDFCYSGLEGSLCEVSCSANKRKKRSLDKTQNFVDLKLDIIRNTSKNDQSDFNDTMITDIKDQTKHPCSQNNMLVTTILLWMCIIIILSGTIALMLYRIYTFNKIKKV